MVVRMLVFELLLVRTSLATRWGEWIPDSPFWRARLDYRAQQVRRIQSSQERWDGLMNMAASGLLVRNYTEKGYDIISTPASVHNLLNETLVQAMQAGRTHAESAVDQITGPRPKFVSVGIVKPRILLEFQPILEAWVRLLWT